MKNKWIYVMSHFCQFAIVWKCPLTVPNAPETLLCISLQLSGNAHWQSQMLLKHSSVSVCNCLEMPTDSPKCSWNTPLYQFAVVWKCPLTVPNAPETLLCISLQLFGNAHWQSQMLLKHSSVSVCSCLEMPTDSPKCSWNSAHETLPLCQFAIVWKSPLQQGVSRSAYVDSAGQQHTTALLISVQLELLTAGAGFSAKLFG